MAPPRHSWTGLRHAPNVSALLGGALAFVTMFVPAAAPAYEVDTHMALSNVAIRRADCLADTYLKDQLLLLDGIQTSTSAGTLAARFEEGARHEDTESTSRPRNHFYNPITNAGLADMFGGTPSMQWAYDDPNNAFDWRAAREAYERSVTSGSKSQRLTELANAFFALGHTVHLVQDLAQPQHTRNDAHITYFPGAPYEDYCHVHYATAGAISTLGGAPLPGLGSSVSPFQGIPGRFASFWDTGQYTGQAAFGGFGSAPGLAEYSNAYFLTDDTMFGTFALGLLPRSGIKPLQVRLTTALDNRSTASTHLFPHPRLQDTNLSSFYPDSNVTRITLQREGEDLAGGLHYVDLTTRGAGSHTTRDLFMVNNSNEIGFDARTYQSYAEQLLPLAQAYSAEMVNYFFRGKIDIQVRWIESTQQYRITIFNRSGETMGAGAWSLYQDDAGDNRQSVAATFNYPGTLADGGSFTATFTAGSQPKGYTLLFKGTLGDETNLAIVSKRFEIVRVHITWTPRSDQDIQMWGPGGTLIWWDGLVTVHGELDNDNIGGLGPENITLKDLQPGTYTFMINYYRDWWREKFFDSGTSTCLPYATPINASDDVGNTCYTQTTITCTVDTYYNASAPVRTITRTLTNPNFGAGRPGIGTGEGASGTSWFVTQTVTVDANRNVTIVGTGPNATAITTGETPPVETIAPPRKPERKLGSEVRP